MCELTKCLEWVCVHPTVYLQIHVCKKWTLTSTRNLIYKWHNLNWRQTKEEKQNKHIHNNAIEIAEGKQEAENKYSLSFYCTATQSVEKKKGNNCFCVYYLYIYYVGFKLIHVITARCIVPISAVKPKIEVKWIETK